ncbi:cbb3-type cytochrome c oxidase subunit 3 [Roseobacteraceae bacterium S113]
METYSFLREFADSWMLLLLFTFFCGIFFWVIRPGSNATHENAAGIALRNTDRPLADQDNEEVDQ